MTALATNVDEHEIIARLRSGDPTAIEALMERFAPRLYRLARGITRNAADAEEVVQDVFATIVQKLDTFEGRARPSGKICELSPRESPASRSALRHRPERRSAAADGRVVAGRIPFSPSRLESGPRAPRRACA